jgi:LPS sulfotransferase NodH
MNGPGTGGQVVVLLGAGRSGTTLLYKLLASHRDIGYFSNYQARWPGWPSTALAHRLLRRLPRLARAAWFGADGGAYLGRRRAPWRAWVPMPAEAEAVYARCGATLDAADAADDEVATRLRAAFESVRRWGGGRVQLSKRTANNRRIALLQRAFPQARYIHLLRDGRAVAQSSLQVDWWAEHRLFWAGKTPRQLQAEGQDPLAVAAQNWVESLQTIERGLGLLDPAAVIELRYEALLQDPATQLRRILDFVGVRTDDAAFWATVAGLGLAPRPEGWARQWTAAQQALVAGIQHTTLARWGYATQA